MTRVPTPTESFRGKGRAGARWIPVLLLCVGCMTMLVVPAAAGQPGGKWGTRGLDILASSQGTATVENGYLRITENTGNSRFALDTTGGNPANPSDDNQPLLSGSGGDWTSFTTVRIDGNNDVFWITGGTRVEEPTASGTSIRSVWMNNTIQVTQTVSLVSNPATGSADVMEIRYLLENTDSASHDVGLRLLLDTHIGENDGAPFQVPGTGAVTTETEYPGSAVPDYFLAFDDLLTPTCLAQGTMRGGAATVPDRLIFASWPDIYLMLVEGSDLWNYPVTPGKIFGTPSYPDSAYAVYWNPVTIGPGGKVGYVTYYGLSGVSQSMESPLILSVTGPLTLDIVNAQYSPNPFTVTGILEDLSGAGISDIKVRIELPAGLSLSGSPQEQTLSLAPNEIQQVSWSVMAEPRTAERQFTYTVFANTTSVPNANLSVTRGVLVPALASPFTPVKVTIVPRTINLASQGYFLAFVKLPQGTKPSEVDKASVECNGAKAVKVFTHGRFSRVFGALFRVSDLENVNTGAKVPFTVTGLLKGGKAFEGTDTVRVIDKKWHGKDPCDDLGKQSGEKLFETQYRES